MAYNPNNPNGSATSANSAPVVLASDQTNLPTAVAVAISSATAVMQSAVAVTGNGTSLTVTGYGTALVQVTGTFVATVNFEASNDAGVTWDAISSTKIGTSTIASSTTTIGQYRMTVTGFDLVRARVTWTSGTSVTINGRATNAVNSSKIVVLAPGANTIGSVGINGTVPVSLATAPTTPVTGTFFQATQPVSLATAPTTPVTGTFFQATQPVSMAAAPTGAALDATITGGTQRNKITDGTNNAAVKAASTAAVASDPALVVAISPNNPVTTTAPVDITATAALTAQNLNPNSGVATAGSAVAVTTMNGVTSIGVQVTGTYTGTLIPQVSNDATNWTNLGGGKQWLQKDNGSYQDNIISAIGVFQITVAGFQWFRLTFTGIPSGTANVSMRATSGSGLVHVMGQLPAGPNQIGNVGQGGTWGVGLNAGSALVGKVGIDQTAPGTTNAVAVATPAVSTTGDTGAKTATVNGATQTNVSAKGASIVFNVGTVSGTTPTLVIKLQGSADGGTTWFDLPNAVTASLVATGIYGIQIYPGLAALAGSTTTGTTATVNGALPRTWRAVYTIGGTSPSFILTNVQIAYLT